MGEMMKTAAFALTHAKRDAGDIGHTIIENVKQATYKGEHENSSSARGKLKK